MNPPTLQILGIDPGTHKTGLALVDSQGLITWRAIVPTPDLKTTLADLLTQRNITKIALGHSTGSEAAASLIKTLLKETQSQATLEIVDEKNSTLEARPLYFEAHPPKGWRKLIPQSLQTPTVPIDDFAAAILARRAQTQQIKVN